MIRKLGSGYRLKDAKQHKRRDKIPIRPNATNGNMRSRMSIPGGQVSFISGTRRA